MCAAWLHSSRAGTKPGQVSSRAAWSPRPKQSRRKAGMARISRGRPCFEIEQTLQPECELHAYCSARTALPLHIEKFVRHPGGRFRGIVDGDRDDERNRVVHV